MLEELAQLDKVILVPLALVAGGGAGAAGDTSPPGQPDGHGGIGVQLPPAFRDPAKQ